MPKTNRKKRSWLNVISSNQTFYLTFILSIIFHVGLLYSIPAVDLFSDQSNADNEEMIVLDLLDDEGLTLGDELALSEEQNHQFQAAIPDIPWDWNEETRESEPDVDTEDPEFKITALKDDYTLLSETQEQTPDLQEVLVKKRDPEEMLTRRFRSKQPEIEKPVAGQVRPLPLEQSESSAEERVSSPEPLPQKSPAVQKDADEELLRFPRRLQNQEEHQKPRLAEKNLTRPALEQRPEQERNLQDLSMVRREKLEDRSRQLGLVRESVEDKNRFGIFAGEKFEAPAFQESEPVSEADKKESEAPDEVTQKAESLQAENEIEGPVRGRAIVYRPRPPQIGSINVEVELRLRFWVLPDGTIGEVIPIKRGNARLEQIAIAYLKKWQFEALSADAPQKKIWGTIPIKFTAQ